VGVVVAQAQAQAQAQEQEQERARPPGQGPVVVGVDGSEESYRAVDRAVDLVAGTDRDLLVVHAVARSGTNALREELSAPSAARPVPPHAQGLLDVALGYARARLDALDPTPGEVSGVLHGGSAAGALRFESRGASLVVIGSRTHGGLTGLLLGSVAVPLSAHADCPVLVVRGGDVREPTADSPVLVGVDGAGCSVPAVGFAMAEAARQRCPLVAVMAWDETWIGAPELAGALPSAAELHQDAVRMVSETLAGASAEHPDVHVTRVVERGHPAQVLLREAVGARLVVVGSRGRGGFAGLLLGSTSQALLHRSPVDVAVVGLRCR